MKKKYLLGILVFGFVISGCTKDTPCSSCGNEEAAVDVSFKVVSPSTRVIGTPEPTDSTNRINQVQIFAFKDDGRLETSKYFENTADSIGIIKITPGVKDFYAFVNSAPITTIKTKEDLALMITNIEDDNSRKSPFFMVAQNFNQTIYKTDDESYKNELIFRASRLVSRVQLQYKVDFSNSNYVNSEFIVDSVYILNGNTKSTCAYTTKDGTRQVSDPKDGMSQLYGNPFYEKFCEVGSWEKLGNSTAVLYPDTYNWFYFYLFPNQPIDDKTATMIVISARLDGTRTYYPIVVNKTGIIQDESGGVPSHKYVTNNTIYKVTATIKGRGGDTPTPIEYIDINVSTDVKDWSQVSQEDEFEF